MLLCRGQAPLPSEYVAHGPRFPPRGVAGALAQRLHAASRLIRVLTSIYSPQASVTPVTWRDNFRPTLLDTGQHGIVSAPFDGHQTCLAA